MKTLSFLSAIILGVIVLTTSCKKEDSSTTTLTIPEQTNYQASVRLGFAESFVILSPISITNTGYCVVNGDIGLSSDGVYVNFPKDAVYGVQEINSALAIAAQNDLNTAYDMTAMRESADMFTLPENIGGLTLTQGLYTSSSLAITSGELILDAKGDENAVFIIKVTDNFVMGANTIITLKGNAKASLVFWQVGGNVVLGETSAFKGTILANQSITLANRAIVEGRLLSRNGGIELNSNTISKPE